MPESLETSKDTVLSLLFALWGGLSNYVVSIRHGKRRFNIYELLGEFVVSGFSGLMVFTMCKAYAVPLDPAVFLSGLGGHYGNKTVYIIQQTILDKYLGIHDEK